jgi:hypothetical protein
MTLLTVSWWYCVRWRYAFFRRFTDRPKEEADIASRVAVLAYFIEAAGNPQRTGPWKVRAWKADDRRRCTRRGMKLETCSAGPRLLPRFAYQDI